VPPFDLVDRETLVLHRVAEQVAVPALERRAAGREKRDKEKKGEEKKGTFYFSFKRRYRE
jgi:hypothetical protein